MLSAATTTTAGRVLRYDFTGPSGTTPTIVQIFASGLGSGLQKLKVGLQLEVPYAFLTQTPPKRTGQILQLGAPTSSGATNLIGIATQGVNGADALAVARATAESVQDCVNPTVPAGSLSNPKTCDIGGKGVAPHSIFTGNQTVSGARDSPARALRSCARMGRGWTMFPASSRTHRRTSTPFFRPHSA